MWPFKESILVFNIKGFDGIKEFEKIKDKLSILLKEKGIKNKYLIFDDNVKVKEVK